MVPTDITAQLVIRTAVTSFTGDVTRGVGELVTVDVVEAVAVTVVVGVFEGESDGNVTVRASSGGNQFTPL